MKQFQRLGGVTLVAALLSGSAANALTADEVWASIQARLAGFGQSVTVGSQTKSGGTLTLKDVTSTFSQPDTTVTITVPEVDLAEGGDGVTLTVPQKATMAVTGKDSKGASMDMALGLTPSGLKSVISGSEADMTYVTSADSLVLSLDSLNADGKPVEATGTLTLAGLASTAHATGTDPQQIDSQGNVQSVKLLIDAKDPEKNGTIHVEADLAALTNATKITLPKGMDPKNMAAALAAGYALSGTFGYGPATMAMDTTEPNGPTKIAGSLASVSGTVEMTKDHLQYGGTSKEAQITLSSPNIPFPQLALTEQEGTFNMVVPVAKSDQTQDFALLMKIIGLGVNNEVWGMADPTGALPHDPATLIVDLAGKGKLGFDLFDPGLKDNPPAMPGQLEALNLNQLQLTAAGADLTGSGAVTFDNSAGPVPKPVGAVDLKLTGGNALIEKLIKMGLIPEDQAMGFKMMLGMFAKPAGDDVMTSKIEFKDDGSILANGQRIQ